MTHRHYIWLSNYLLWRTRRELNERNAVISVFTLDFRRSLESTTIVGFFMEQWLVIKPILFEVLSLEEKTKLKAKPDWYLLGVEFKVFDEKPQSFHMRVSPRGIHFYLLSTYSGNAC